jgi:hypothetical protein
VVGVVVREGDVEMFEVELVGGVFAVDFHAMYGQAALIKAQLSQVHVQRFNPVRSSACDATVLEVEIEL